MATRKPVNDPEALLTATDTFTRMLDETVVADHGDTRAMAEGIAASFRYAEFETVTTKVAGEDITMRRLVLTTDWAVQTN
jgi:hypothetical protein